MSEQTECNPCRLSNEWHAVSSSWNEFSLHLFIFWEVKSDNDFSLQFVAERSCAIQRGKNNLCRQLESWRDKNMSGQQRYSKRQRSESPSRYSRSPKRASRQDRSQSKSGGRAYSSNSYRSSYDREPRSPSQYSRSKHLNKLNQKA